MSHRSGDTGRAIVRDVGEEGPRTHLGGGDGVKPRARRGGLLVREIGEETLVYDSTRHEAHCLNAPAAFVYRQCDGRTPVEEIVRRMREQLGPAAGAPLVQTALEGLGQAGLLEASPSPPRSVDPGRRALLRGAGASAALLLPAVVSLVAPTPAEAAASCVDSCLGQPDGTPCDCLDPTPPCSFQCQSQVCAGSPGGPC
jgi:hypothetical protein